MAGPYYNTVGETGGDLADYTDKARKQEDRLLAFLQAHPGITVTNESIQETLFNNEIPITSARRAMSNLYEQGLVKKVGTVRGQYGRKIYQWRLVRY